MDVTVPELEYVAVTLAPERHTTRGFGRPPAPLTDVVTLGMPVVQRVTSDLAGADTSLTQFLRDNDSRWKFHIVHLGCSFRPPAGMNIAKARLSVELGAADEATRPIVWSLSPQRMQRAVERSRGLKLGANLGIAETAVEVTVAGEASEVFIESFGLQESACAWEFRQTVMDSVSGTHRLAVVTRSQRDLSPSGRISMSATITYRRFKLLQFRSDLTEQEPLAFQLAA